MYFECISSVYFAENLSSSGFGSMINRSISSSSIIISNDHLHKRPPPSGSALLLRRVIIISNLFFLIHDAVAQ